MTHSVHHHCHQAHLTVLTGLTLALHQPQSSFVASMSTQSLQALQTDLQVLRAHC